MEPARELPSSDGFGLGRLGWRPVSRRTGHRAAFLIESPTLRRVTGAESLVVLLQRLFPLQKQFPLRSGIEKEPLGPSGRAK